MKPKQVIILAFCVFALVSLALTGLIGRRQDSAIIEIEKLGGKVRRDDSGALWHASEMESARCTYKRGSRCRDRSQLARYRIDRTSAAKDLPE